MIKAENGKVILRGIRSHVLADTVIILRALKEVVSEEDYKTVIRLADESEKQLSGETERMREVIKELFGL